MTKQVLDYYLKIEKSHDFFKRNIDNFLEQYTRTSVTNTAIEMLSANIVEYQIN